MFEFKKENIHWQKGSYGLPEAVLKIKVPSVGQILSIIPDPEYDEWVKAVGKEKVEQIMVAAANRGSSTHTFIENFIFQYSKTKDISEALKYTQIESPKKLESEKIPKEKINEGRDLFYKFYYSDYASRYSDMLALEMGIYSASLFYRGKLDILYKDKLFGISITDFKTSNGEIKKGSIKELKYFYQLGGYSLGLDEMLKEKGIICNRASILCIDKKSDILQEIELNSEKLNEYKEKFKTLCLDWHKINKSLYLIN